MFCEGNLYLLDRIQIYKLNTLTYSWCIVLRCQVFMSKRLWTFSPIRKQFNWQLPFNIRNQFSIYSRAENVTLLSWFHVHKVLQSIKNVIIMKYPSDLIEITLKRRIGFVFSRSSALLFRPVLLCTQKHLNPNRNQFQNGTENKIRAHFRRVLWKFAPFLIFAFHFATLCCRCPSFD